MKRVKARIRTWAWLKNRRLLRVIAVVAFICTTVIYGVWSKAVWDSVAQSDGGWNSVVAQTKEAFALPADTVAEKEAKRTALHQTVQAAQASQDPCGVAGMIAWQQVFGDLKRQLQHCAEGRARVQQLARQLESVLAFLQDDASAVRALTELQAQKSEVDETNFANMAGVWEKAARDMAGTTVGEHFKPVKEKAVSSLEAGAAKWKDLIAAHEAKNKERFLKVQQEVVMATMQLSGIYELEQQELLKLITSFQETLDTLH